MKEPRHGKYRRWTRERIAEVEALRKQGMSYAELGERYSMTEHGLRSAFNRAKRHFKYMDEREARLKEAADDDD